VSKLDAAAVASLGANWDALLAGAPGYSLLQAAYFCDAAKLAQESLLVHRDGEPLFLLPLARAREAWVSHPETFACGLLPLAAAGPQDVWPAVQAVSKALTGRQLTLRLRPAVMSPSFGDHESGAWRLLPSAVVRNNAVMVVDLAAGLALSSRRRRALSKAAKNGLTARIVRDAHELRLAWQCIADVYAQRGLSDLLPVERVLALAALPGGVAAVLAVEVDGRVVGAALGYRLGQAYRLPVYGVLDVPGSTGGTETLIDAAADVACAAGCAFLDLGTSSDPRTGLTVPGIASFKAEMGARPRPVEHLLVDLRATPAR
jgi:CelD/BcsL family acetyltransferase involved in cellulose biosynthesis